MSERNLRASQPKRFVPTTSDGRADAPSPNLVAGDRPPAAPGEVLAGDITHIPTTSGWLYLAIVIHLYSRRIVGWTLADHMRSELVTAALGQAVNSGPASGGRGGLFHSDRGSQYGSRAFRQALAEAGLCQSMSRRANPYDECLDRISHRNPEDRNAPGRGV